MKRKKLLKRALIGKKQDTEEEFHAWCQAFNREFNR